MKLPEAFIKEIEESYGSEEAAELFAVLDKPMYHALRVNTHKISVDDFLRISPFKLTPVPWCKEGFYYEDSDLPSKHPYYFAGLYYLQEPSAMLPAAVLPIEEGDRVLDLCAAPGGKSTAIVARLKGTGLLVSNDISASRAKALIKNLELFGTGNYIVTCEYPEKLSTFFKGYFDKILIDAPCSGEGMFRKSVSMITAWESAGPSHFVPIQRDILKRTVSMLKPGGKLLYSTCTYCPEEDEENVRYLLDIDKSLRLIAFDMHEGFLPGLYDDVKCTVHLFPHRIKGEGHFAALFEKENTEDAVFFTYNGKINSPVNKGKKASKLPDEFFDFLKCIDYDFDLNLLEQASDKIYYVSDLFPDTSGLRTLRRGLMLGEIKNGHFKPSESLAMWLRSDMFNNTLNLKCDDDRVIRYLKGETIEGEIKDGWVLIAVDGYPLGFGKAKNDVVKNKYLPGWRMM